MVLLRERIARRGIGAIELCLPSPAKRPSAGAGWIHEIKHDCFRLLARKGNDLGRRFPRMKVKNPAAAAIAREAEEDCPP
jgi:hypothetical protein